MSPALQADSLPAEPQGNTGVGSLFLLQWNPLDPGIELVFPALKVEQQFKDNLKNLIAFKEILHVKILKTWLK